jgi:hypothetical protein
MGTDSIKVIVGAVEHVEIRVFEVLDIHDIVLCILKI